MSWIITPGFSFDTDAAGYIAAVEAADGEALETGTRYAIDNFVIGCKQDGIWDAIKASCILAGARTLSGALVPLKGTAPTNFNFVAGDYNRKTGLVGNGSTKYLNSNQNNNADPQNNRHLAAYATTSQPSGTGFYIGGRTSAGSNIGASTLGSDSNQHFSRSSCATLSYVGPTSNGLLGTSRSSSNTYIARNGQANTAISQNSEVPANRLLTLFSLNQDTGVASGTYSNARIAFYSIGEALDLAKLDARVSSLITAIGAAIP